ncbi:hypothetical protein [Acinetobacter sp. NigerLNRRAM0016]
MNTYNTGSSTELSTLAPKIMLTPLLNAMVSTLKEQQSKSFFYYGGPNNALNFDASAFVAAVFKKIGSKKEAKPIYNIIKDIQLLPHESKLRISTLFDKESEIKTAEAYREFDLAMAETVNQLIMDAPNGFNLQNLDQVLGNYQEVVKNPNSNRKHNAVPIKIQGEARILPLQYTSDLKVKNGLLRLFTVTEELEAPNWVNEVCTAIKTIVKLSYPVDEKISPDAMDFMEGILSDVIATENNDIQNLLTFVETQALSRARTKNCFKIMEIIADYIESNEKNEYKRTAAVSYIRKAKAFFEIFGERVMPWNTETTDIENNFILNVGAIYGAVGALDLNYQLGYVRATEALPIWVRPNVEMNDIRAQDEKGLSIKREVTYAFRVNGEFAQEEKSSRFNSRLLINNKKCTELPNSAGSMLTAYESRLISINEALLLSNIVNEKNEMIDEPILVAECQERVCKNELFQLIMLYFVLSDDLKIEAFKEKFALLADMLKQPEKMRTTLSAILNQRLNTDTMHRKVKAITDTIKKALNDSCEPIMQEMDKDSSLKTKIFVQPNIVNLDVFKPSIFGDDVEQYSSIFHGENNNFYDYIMIVDGSRKKMARMGEDETQRMNQYARKALSELEFKSTLKVKTLVPLENTNPDLSQFTVQRDLSAPCLPVVMVPTKRKQPNEAPYMYHHESLHYDDFLSLNRVMIHYRTQLFRLSDLKGGADNLCLDETENGLIMSSTCFSMIMHSFLKHLIKAVKVKNGLEQRIYIPFLRIDSVDEHENEENARNYGSRKANQKGGFNPESKRAYATAYSLEKLLNNEDSIFKVQGLKYNPDPRIYTSAQGDRLCSPVNLKMDRTISYRISAAIEALSGYSEVIVPFEGTKDRVACISYNSRPENDVEFKYQTQKDLLTLKPDYSYICYVYGLERINDKQGRLVLKKISHAPVMQDNLRTSKALHRILEGLQSEGYKDVVLLSHHFAQRKIGKTESNNNIHESESALDQLDQLFPELNFYPCQSDTIPALNIKQREIGSLCEVPHHQHHTASANCSIHKQSLSILSIATMKTVGARTQNGICSYFYMLTSQEHSIHNDKRTKLHAKVIDTQDTNEMKAIRSVLRGVHYYESERPSGTERAEKKFYNPILQPSHIRGTTGIQELGEIIVSKRQTKGEVLMSLPAMIGKLEEYIIEKKELEAEFPVEEVPVEDSTTSQNTE